MRAPIESAVRAPSARGGHDSVGEAELDRTHRLAPDTAKHATPGTRRESLRALVAHLISKQTSDQRSLDSNHKIVCHNDIVFYRLADDYIPTEFREATIAGD